MESETKKAMRVFFSPTIDPSKTTKEEALFTNYEQMYHYILRRPSEEDYYIHIDVVAEVFNAAYNTKARESIIEISNEAGEEKLTLSIKVVDFDTVNEQNKFVMLRSKDNIFLGYTTYESFQAYWTVVPNTETEELKDFTPGKKSLFQNILIFLLQKAKRGSYSYVVASLGVNPMDSYDEDIQEYLYLYGYELYKNNVTEFHNCIDHVCFSLGEQGQPLSELNQYLLGKKEKS